MISLTLLKVLAQRFHSRSIAEHGIAMTLCRNADAQSYLSELHLVRAVAFGECARDIREVIEETEKLIAGERQAL